MAALELTIGLQNNNFTDPPCDQSTCTCISYIRAAKDPYGLNGVSIQILLFSSMVYFYM